VNILARDVPRVECPSRRAITSVSLSLSLPRRPEWITNRAPLLRAYSRWCDRWFVARYRRNRETRFKIFPFVVHQFPRTPSSRDDLRHERHLASSNARLHSPRTNKPRADSGGWPLIARRAAPVTLDVDARRRRRRINGGSKTAAASTSQANFLFPERAAGLLTGTRHWTRAENIYRWAWSVWRQLVHGR